MAHTFQSSLPMEMNKLTIIERDGTPLFSKLLWTTATGKDHGLCHIHFFTLRVCLCVSASQMYTWVGLVAYMTLKF